MKTANLFLKISVAFTGLWLFRTWWLLLSPQLQTQTSQWTRCWRCLSDRRRPHPLPFYLWWRIVIVILYCAGVHFFTCCVYHLNDITLYQWLTLAVAVGWGLWQAQHSLKLLLEAVSSLQQRLQPVDELCTDDVLNTETLSWAIKHGSQSQVLTISHSLKLNDLKWVKSASWRRGKMKKCFFKPYFTPNISFGCFLWIPCDLFFK